MKQRQIGAVIKEISIEKNLKVAKLSELSGKNRQAVYMTFGRSEMTNEEIKEWAKVLGVTYDELFDRWKNPSEDDTSVSSNYLLEHLANLEEQFKRLLGQLEIKDKQLEVKDQQMAGLQKTVEVLLGKYSVSEDVTCTEEDEPNHVLNSLTTGMVA